MGLPPEAVLWKDTAESQTAIQMWVRQHIAEPTFKREDSGLLGVHFIVDVGEYQVVLRPGQFLCRMPGTGRFEAMDFNKYMQMYN